MKIETNNGTVSVSDLPELGAAQAAAFQAEVSAALPDRPGVIEVNLARTVRVDCSGLGALVAVFDRAQQRHRGATLRVVDAPPPVRQMLELTRLHRIFSVVGRDETAG